jgi:hypothetical protein
MAKSRKSQKAKITSSVTSETKSSIKSSISSPRQFRDRKTFVTSPIKPKDTHALQWSRWNP